MNLIELDHALRKLRLYGMASDLERSCARHRRNTSNPSTSRPRSWATNCGVARIASSNAAPTFHNVGCGSNRSITPETPCEGQLIAARCSWILVLFFSG